MGLSNFFHERARKKMEDELNEQRFKNLKDREIEMIHLFSKAGCAKIDKGTYETAVNLFIKGMAGDIYDVEETIMFLEEMMKDENL